MFEDVSHKKMVNDFQKMESDLTTHNTISILV